MTKPKQTEWDPATQLREAVRVGDPDWVTSAVQAGAALGPAEDRSSILADAIQRCAEPGEGRVEGVVRLLDAGATVYPCDTPLHLAVKAGSDALVARLVARGADVNAANEWEGQHFTPLHLAAAGGHGDIVLRLLEAGADPAAKDWNAATPLHHAATDEVGALLLDRRADVHAANHYGLTPLHLAAAAGRTALVQRLLEAGAAVRGPPHQETALHLAAQSGHLEVVQLLLARGADVKATASFSQAEGLTPLHLAAWNGHFAVCEALLRAGASWQAKASNGETPRSRACAWRGDPERPTARFVAALDALAAAR
jgi:ankyrin repeat protein